MSSKNGDVDRLIKEYRAAKRAWELRKEHLAQGDHVNPYCTYFKENYVGFEPLDAVKRVPPQQTAQQQSGVFEGWAAVLSSTSPNELRREPSKAASSSSHWPPEQPSGASNDSCSESESSEGTERSRSLDFESAASSTSGSSDRTEGTQVLSRAADSLRLEVQAVMRQERAGEDANAGRSLALKQPPQEDCAAAAVDQGRQWWRRLLRRTESGS